MPSFKYVIELSDQDKATLMAIVKKGNSPARTILRANILLASDKRNDKYITLSEIADAYHTSIASLYATFPPQRARDLANHLEIHYPPKNRSRLDIAEIALSALGRQCIANNRIPDLPSLRSLLEPWAVARNFAQKGIDWHFTTDNARTKLKHLYPIIKI